MCVTPAQEKILVGWSGGKDNRAFLTTHFQVILVS